ncbi:MAG: flagellar biosynthetic protein FliO [Brevinematia bacterium]
MKKGILLIFYLFLSFSPVFPETNQQTNNKTFLDEFYREEERANQRRVKTPNPFWTTIKILFYLALLGGGGFFLVRWIVKKASIPQSEDTQFVEVILTKMIGMNTYIHIVKIINDYYILSQSNEVRLIEKIEDKETIDFIELNKEKMKPKEVKFLDILGNIPAFKKTDKISFLKTQKEKLKKF